MPSATTPLASAGKAAEGEPRVRRPAARRQLEPLAEGRIRAPTALRPRGARRACSGPGPLGPRRACERASRGQDDDDLRRLGAALRGRLERSPGARLGQRARRVLLRRRADLVRAVHLADRPLPGRRVERLGLQGQRRLAPGGGRQGDAERRRSGALVLGDLRADGRAEDPAPATPPEGLLSRGVRGRRGQDGRRGGGRPRDRRASRPDARRLGVPRGASRARAGDARRRRALERRSLNVRAGLVSLLVALALAGCGEERTGSGTASLWVTRARGADVIHTGTVPAGISALEAVDRELDVETRYGGRFVQSIDGVDGSLADQRDWFWYVNGLEGDTSAAEYRLHPGDVLWWDYRSWATRMQVPVVVGAFPEPFVHGLGADDAPRLARNPRLARYRYEGLP